MSLKWNMRKPSFCKLARHNCVRQGSLIDAKDNRETGKGTFAPSQIFLPEVPF